MTLTLWHWFIQDVFDDVLDDGLAVDGALVGQVDGLVRALTVVALLFVLRREKQRRLVNREIVVFVQLQKEKQRRLVKKEGD
jgi:hypothetical protein